MMSQTERKTRSDYIRYLWNIIRQQKQNQATTPKIVKYLAAQINLTSEETESLLLNAIDDGLLEVNHGTGGGPNRSSKKTSDTRNFKIPNIESIKNNELNHDWYCIVCRSPKDIQKCSDCLRVFHQECSLPNQDEDIPTSHLHPRLTDQNELGSPEESRQEITLGGMTQENTSLIETDTTVEEIVFEILDEKPTINKTEENYNILKNDIPNLKSELDEIDTKDTKDIICIGEVRPPSRRRQLSILYKPESSDLNEQEIGENSKNLCPVCRMIKKTCLKDPPNMGTEETNYLLKFLFDRIKSWISADTFSPLQFSSSITMSSKKDLELFIKMCFKFPKTLEDIDHKIKQNGYKKLTEFQCDIMDIQHCIGILYGSSSAEYEATKYLLSDCSYELSEIRQCRDCYRHSNEKSTKFWFCKPCVIRHELVFAKQTGYSYWPAKVIKVNDNQYDVRFFGAQHSRAIIDSNFVKSIDTELKFLKIKKSVSFNKAMEELVIHKELLQLPAGQFSYDAERIHPIEILVPELLNQNENSFKKKNETNQKISKSKKINRKIENINNYIKQRNSSSNPPNLLENNQTNCMIEIVSSQDSTSYNLKRKRNPIFGNVLDFSSSNDSEESTISDYLMAKKSKLNLTLSEPKLDKSPLKKNNIKNRKMNAKKRFDNINQDQIEASTSSSGEPIHQAISQESLVTSTQEITIQKKQSKQPSSARIKAKLEKPHSDVVEALRRELLTIKNHSVANKLALDTLQAEIDRWQLKLQQKVSETKKRQWCYFCEKEAIYHCCWNTAYCSTDCQQKHWQAEHKKACRRKR